MISSQSLICGTSLFSVLSSIFLSRFIFPSAIFTGDTVMLTLAKVPYHTCFQFWQKRASFCKAIHLSVQKSNIQMTDVSIFDFLLCKTEGIVGSTSVRLGQLSGRDFDQRLSDLGKASHMIARSDFPPAQWDQEMPLKLLKLFFPWQPWYTNSSSPLLQIQSISSEEPYGSIWSQCGSGGTVDPKSQLVSCLMGRWWTLTTSWRCGVLHHLRLSWQKRSLVAETSGQNHLTRPRRFLESSLDEEKYQILGIFLSCT